MGWGIATTRATHRIEDVAGIADLDEKLKNAVKPGDCVEFELPVTEKIPRYRGG